MITSEIKGAKDIKDTNVFFLEPKINAVEEFLKKKVLPGIACDFSLARIDSGHE